MGGVVLNKSVSGMLRLQTGSYLLNVLFILYFKATYYPLQHMHIVSIG